MLPICFDQGETLRISMVSESKPFFQCLFMSFIKIFAAESLLSALNFDFTSLNCNFEPISPLITRPNPVLHIRLTFIDRHIQMMHLIRRNSQSLAFLLRNQKNARGVNAVFTLCKLLKVFDCSGNSASGLEVNPKIERGKPNCKNDEPFEVVN